MTDLTITLTLDEAKTLLHSAQRDFDEYRVDRERAVLDRLAKKIEETIALTQAMVDAGTRGLR